jgi:hypothetical protein
MASLNLNCGPPLSAMKSWPSSWKYMTRTVPTGHGPASPQRVTLTTFEFLKIDV